MSTTTRRSLLRSVTAFGAASLLERTSFAADSSSDAIVAIHLIGGNDSNNMLVPTDSEYATYARGRGELAIARNSILNISAASQHGSWGFHPSMSELRRLYDQGALGVVANVGAMTARANRESILAKQVSLPADAMIHSSGSRWHFVQPGFAAPPWTEALQQPVTEQEPLEVYGFSSGLLLMPAERAHIEGSQIDNKKLMAAIKGATPIRTSFPDTGLGLQLYQVARLLQVGEGLGLTRPVFSASLGGFDTHADQLGVQADLFAKLSQAMGAFYEATRELGISGRVTAYTDTEFNRTLAPNQTHGSDHAWGGHHLVMGGSIRGGDIHGEMPSLELSGRSDAGMRGVWIPTTSAHDYQSRFAQRYGLAGASSSLAV